MKNKLLLIFIIFFQFSFAQEKIIHGKISAEGNNVEGINIINLVNERSTVSDVNGAFQILAKVEDLLVFTAVNFEYKRKIITTEDLRGKTIEIKMTPKVGQIDEVVITQYKNINAVDLGILSKPAKVYTPAERRVRTATTGLLDPLVNLISGRTKKLKDNVQIERRIFLLEKIDDLFEDEYFVEKLKIPEDKISGFKYYAVEDAKLVSALNSKNRVLSDLIFVQLSQKYKALLSDEKK